MSKPPSHEVQKRIYYLVGSFFGIITLYIILRKLELTLLVDCIYIATSALFVVYFYLSYGFAKDLPTKDDLNPAWSEERRSRYAERIRRNKEKSKALIYPMLPLMAVMAFDLIMRAFFSS